MQKPLSESQRHQLCNLMYLAFLDIRVLGWEGRAAQAGALADAFHNLPNGMWSADFDLQIFRDLFLAAYERKYPGNGIAISYVAAIDRIIAAA